MDKQFYVKLLSSWENRKEEKELELKKATKKQEKALISSSIETCDSAIKNCNRILKCL